MKSMKRIFIHPYVYPAIPIYHGLIKRTKYPHRLLYIIASYYGLTVREIKSESRKPLVVRARDVAAFILSKKYDVRDGAIAKIINRDRTSVVTMRKKNKVDIDYDVITIQGILDKKINLVN